MTPISEINWYPFIPLMFPNRELEIVTLTKISVCNPAQNLLTARRWTRRRDGSYGFLFPRKENIVAYAEFREFLFLPWRPFVSEEIPKKEMALLFFNPLSNKALYKMKTDRWFFKQGKWVTEKQSEKLYAHWCPLSIIALPKGV